MRALFTPLLIVLALMTPVAQAFQLKAEHVVDSVYALIGPLGQRSADNDGLNANFGFVVTPSGVILIDSGASRLSAEKGGGVIALTRSRTGGPATGAHRSPPGKLR